MIDEWGCIIVEPVEPSAGELYKAPKVSVPCFVYRVPEDVGEATFRATVGPSPKPDSGPVKPVVAEGEALPKLALHNEEEAEIEAADSETEAADSETEAAPSEEEQGGEVEPDDK